MKDLFQAAIYGEWHVGFHEIPSTKDHKFISYYSTYYDGDIRALWIGKLCIELSW